MLVCAFQNYIWGGTHSETYGDIESCYYLAQPVLQDVGAINSQICW